MKEEYWKGKHYAFYQNRACEYFPCHTGVKEEEFNCLFCYCPLYMLGKDCGGNPCYTENGRKDCSNCIVPHSLENYGKIIGKYEAIQKQMQDFEEGKYPHVIRKNQKTLRCGITTGTCSAAATVAAASDLLFHIPKTNVLVETPQGKVLDVEVHFVERGADFCEYMVVKDSGDDPDVTNGAEIHVRVERKNGDWLKDYPNVFSSKGYPGIYLEGGTGIGRITQDGFEQKIGQAAINTVPRKMIFQGIGEVAALAENEGDLLVTVSVPGGEVLAEKTFNGRLGIEGGISILGTSGMIEPMSEKAIIDTIELEIKQLANAGEKTLLVTPGNYGQTYALKYLKLDVSKSVKCSNYIGETIDLAISYGMDRVFLVGNIGKLIKLAAGIMNTHSRVADARCEIMAIHTVLCGGTKEMAEKIMECVNTDRMLDCLVEWGLKDQVIESICKKIDAYMHHRIGEKMQYTVVLFSEKYGYLGKIGE